MTTSGSDLQQQLIRLFHEADEDQNAVMRYVLEIALPESKKIAHPHIRDFFERTEPAEQSKNIFAEVVRVLDHHPKIHTFEDLSVKFLAEIAKTDNFFREIDPHGEESALAADIEEAKEIAASEKKPGPIRVESAPKHQNLIDLEMEGFLSDIKQAFGTYVNIDEVSKRFSEIRMKSEISRGTFGRLGRA